MPKTILITGAISGIGKATTRLFAARGWNVVATMRNAADNGELEAENVMVTRLDLTDHSSVREAVHAAHVRFGGLDALVNNAGYGAYGPLEATPMAVIRQQFEVNLFGLVAVTQAVLPIMRKQKQGTIVNISSVGGRMAYPFGALYHGSKWAVEGLSEALHFEARALGIRVKIVEPGGVRTDFGGRSFVFTNDPNLTEYQPLVRALLAAREAGANASGQQEPEEVAEVVWTAVTDGTEQLRYISGDGAKELLATRYSPDRDEAFVVGMRARTGL
jgi:NAD(P)-dependent dehydrogenase (short-subunit alcohol dehydrogenase family)